MLIPGYHIIQELYVGDDSIVFRAQRETDQYPVVLKALKAPYPSPERIARFKREYEITHRLNLTGVVGAYSLEVSHDRWFMVLEDFGAESLERLQLAGRLALSDFLTLALHVTDVLGHLHQRRIVHKDLNPSNIVLNPHTGQVKLIDFGISTVLSRENSTFRNPEMLEGTLAYISPEQTGRMNRAVDYRTDLYSLGVTFYELLTGELPFHVADPLELIHAHIARRPPSPRAVNAACPEPLTEIVLRLLAKNAEDRYQSAIGLKADLQECLDQWQTSECIEPFPLGRQDISDRFQLPQKLYGRESEIEKLLAAFERASQGASELLLVTGQPGIGKTALVQETYKPVTRQHGYFVFGKFDLLQHNIPYAALIQALRALLRLLLAESETRIAAWRDKLSAVLGPNGQIIAEVIPEVTSLLGPQPPAPLLASAEAQNRFNLVFLNFIQVFAQPEHPLVIFLDDLQWADRASLKLLQTLVTAQNSHHLFLIGAYRDTEVDAAHPLQVTLNAMQQAGVSLGHFTLGPLDLTSVEQFVSDTLQCVAPHELAELVLAKTGGNPFFVGEFLKSLHVEALLEFDQQCGRWQWSIEKIQARGVTDNVVDLLAERAQRLNPATQRVLQLAACIGNQFDLTTLAAVYERTLHETAHDLWEALAEGLVLPLSEAYTLAQLDVRGLAETVRVDYRFAHDRVQQAIYSLISATDRASRHWRIGRWWLQHATPEALEQQIFDIVNQLNLGSALAVTQSARDELASLNLRAGQKAKASSAFEPAFNYLMAGLELLGDDAWESHYDRALALHSEAAEAALLSGDLARSDQLSQLVLDRALSPLDAAAAYQVRMRVRTAQNQMMDAVHIGLQALERLGVSLPEKPGQPDIAREVQTIRSAIADRDPEDLVSLPPMIDPEKLAATEIMATLAASAYMTVPELFTLTILRRVNLMIEYGNTPLAADVYVSFGASLCGALGDLDLGYRFGKLALSLSERPEARSKRAYVCFFFSVFIGHWKESLQDTLPVLMEAYHSGLETGDFEYAARAIFLYSYGLYMTGQPLEAAEAEIKTYHHIIQHQFKHGVVANMVEIYQQAVANLIGRTQDPCRLKGEYLDEDQLLPALLAFNEKTRVVHIYIQRLLLNYLFHDYERAAENASSADKLLIGTQGTYNIPVFYFYETLTRLALLPDQPPEERERTIEKVTANLDKLKRWSQSAPRSHLHKYYLVEAEYARVSGRAGEAREYYDLAITAAQENGYLNEEALAYELAGQFYFARGHNKLAQVYLRDAHYAYQRWGAATKAKDLESRYPQFLTQAESESTSRSIATSTKRTADMLDLTSVMKAAQALSSEIVLEKLLASLIKIVIENAGAQNGYLILNKGGHWVIEAAGTADRAEVHVLQSIPVEADPLLMPSAVINYVARTQDRVVLNAATREGPFMQDPWLVAHQAKSILCLPLLQQGRLIGLLYVENNLATHVFTPARLQVLQLLSGQMAISLENARLYHELESRVRERTVELSQTNVQLQQEIGEREQAELALRESNAELQARNEELDAFAHSVAHDLKNPVAQVITATELLLDAEYPLDDEKRKQVTLYAVRAGRKMNNIVDELLLLSSVRQWEVEASPLDMEPIVAEAQQRLADMIEQAQAEISAERIDCWPLASGHAAWVEEVWANYLSNAIKYGGQPPHVELGADLQSDGMVRYWVRDNGPGLALEDQARLFTPFTRLGQVRAKGHGLGLSIVRRIVEKLGGQVGVESQPGQGSTFFFTLPAA
jgi:predicted ATPase/signal transduction histidine kinase/tRNA A-37 threonylcarbamoyl transferase component Bud32